MLLLKALIAPGAFLAVVTKEGECCYLLEQRACEKKAVLERYLLGDELFLQRAHAFTDVCTLAPPDKKEQSFL